MRRQSPPLTSVDPARFFVLTYLLSWGVWLPLVASHFGIGPLSIPAGTISLLGLIGVLMPATSALILTARSGGRREVGSLLSRLRTWRVGAGWWAAAVVVQPVLLVAAGVVANLAWGPSEVPSTVPDAGYLAVTVVFLLIAVLGEEIGWRGVALPGLQQRTSVLAATLILGCLWAGWHLPFWLLQDSYTQYGPGYLGLNLLLIVPFSAYITWFFNHSRFSILLPVCFHLAFNIVNTTLFQVTMSIPGFVILIAVEWIVGLAVLSRMDSPEARALRSAAG